MWFAQGIMSLGHSAALFHEVYESTKPTDVCHSIYMNAEAQLQKQGLI